MNWRERSGDDRSQSPSLRRRTSEPRIEENRHCHSHWFSGSAREGPVTNGLAGSSVRDRHEESRLYENRDEHFRELSQFCENFQRESPSKKFRWENLFAKNPGNANSKSSLVMEHVNGYDGDNRGLRVSGSHLISGSSSKVSLVGNNLCTFHMNFGATKDSNINDGDPSRSFGINDCRHLSSSRKFEGPVHETRGVHDRDRPMFESARNSLRERRNETSSYGTQASHPHCSARVTESKGISQDEFHGFYEDRLPLTSPDSTWKKEKPRELVETEASMGGLLEHKQAMGNHIEHFVEDRNQYFKIQPCKRSDIGASLNSHFSQQTVRIPQYDFYKDSTRTSVVMDPVFEGFEDTESYVMGDMEESRPSDRYGFFKEPFIIEGSYMGNAPFAMEQDDEILGSGTGSPLNCEREACTSSEMLILADDGNKTNYGQWLHEDGSLVSKHEQDLGDVEDNRKLRWKAADSKKSRVKGKRFASSRCEMHYSGSDSSRKRNVFSRIQFLSHEDEKSTVGDININLNCRNKRGNDNDTSISLTSFKRPLPWVINHASQRPKSKLRDLKKRLGVSLRDSSSNTLLKKRERRRDYRLRNTNVNHGCLDVQAGDCFEEKTQRSTSRQCEGPEELNQLIKSAFYKFIKVLIENPARRKKFTEPGSGIIKCIVCGSKSKEFADALSLSQHAFQSLEGSRAEHLGFHKALCWLMGWSGEAAPNGPWVRRILPHVEAFAWKEDLIIWPPVLIIHNSSIAVDNTSERVTISCEELEVFIRGMGFGGRIKVVRGKPGNQSIMIATFGAMFSGLQEAERLHKNFVDNSHGRDEFQKINSSHLTDSHKDLHKTGANTMESLLYGYLGLAEDLDKLDFETKKRSVVKSKKEIQAIVYASLHF